MAIDRGVDVAPEVRVEGNVTIIPVLEEVLVVEKRLVLKEKLHISYRTIASVKGNNRVPMALRSVVQSARSEIARRHTDLVAVMRMVPAVGFEKWRYVR
jgi:hypothetical protein